MLWFDDKVVLHGVPGLWFLLGVDWKKQDSKDSKEASKEMPSRWQAMNTWEKYEAEKKKIRWLATSSEDYEKRIAELIERMKL